MVKPAANKSAGGGLRLVREAALRSPRRIGPLAVAPRRDSRGGLYFRTLSAGDGLGPDVISYGFCYRPNSEGLPFGAACYSLSRLSHDWYSFAASNDYY